MKGQTVGRFSYAGKKSGNTKRNHKKILKNAVGTLIL